MPWSPQVGRTQLQEGRTLGAPGCPPAPRAGATPCPAPGFDLVAQTHLPGTPGSLALARPGVPCPAPSKTLLAGMDSTLHAPGPVTRSPRATAPLGGGDPPLQASGTCRHRPGQRTGRGEGRREGEARPRSDAVGGSGRHSLVSNETSLGFYGDRSGGAGEPRSHPRCRLWIAGAGGQGGGQVLGPRARGQLANPRAGAPLSPGGQLSWRPCTQSPTQPSRGGGAPEVP